MYQYGLIITSWVFFSEAFDWGRLTMIAVIAGIIAHINTCSNSSYFSIGKQFCKVHTSKHSRTPSHWYYYLFAFSLFFEPNTAPARIDESKSTREKQKSINIYVNCTIKVTIYANAKHYYYHSQFHLHFDVRRGGGYTLTATTFYNI